MVSTDEKLNELVERLRDAAGANLESVILYGSAARGDFRESHSDLNVLCTLRSLAVDELSRIAPVVTWWCREQKEPAPMFFTTEELRNAADVFSIELLDMQKNHRVLFGTDVVSGLKVPMNLHRVQVEHDLRMILLRLRQHCLLAHESSEELAKVLGKSFSSVRTLLRHALIALGQEPPPDTVETIGRMAVLTGADAGAFRAVQELRESGHAPGSLKEVYGAYLQALEKVIRALDRHLPKREWQRAGAAKS